MAGLHEQKWPGVCKTWKAPDSECSSPTTTAAPAFLYIPSWLRGALLVFHITRVTWWIYRLKWTAGIVLPATSSASSTRAITSSRSLPSALFASRSFFCSIYVDWIGKHGWMSVFILVMIHGLSRTGRVVLECTIFHHRYCPTSQRHKTNNGHTEPADLKTDRSHIGGGGSTKCALFFQGLFHYYLIMAAGHTTGDSTAVDFSARLSLLPAGHGNWTRLKPDPRKDD
jgi:hypothetical protein